MAIAFVQSKAAGAVPSPTTAAFTNNVVAGNNIIVAVSGNSATTTVSSITDTLGNTYVAVGSAGGGSLVTFFYITKSGSSGANTVTVNTSVATLVVIDIREYSGMPNVLETNSALLRDPISQGLTGSTTSVSKNITSIYAETLLLSAVCNNGSNTYIGSASNIDSSTSSTLVMTVQDQIVQVPAITTVTFTQSSTASWNFLGIGIKAYLPTVINNYQQLKVGDGMSISEKVR